MPPNSWYPEYLNESQFGSWLGPMGSYGDPGNTGITGSGTASVGMEAGI